MRSSSFSIGVAVFGALMLASCASPGSSASANGSAQDIGTKISKNLQSIHDQYCSGTPDAKMKLAAVKAKGAPLRIIDEQSGKASRSWFIVEPSSTQSGSLSSERWGIYVQEPEGANGCGVGYVQPRQLDAFKSGKPL